MVSFKQKKLLNTSMTKQELRSHFKQKRMDLSPAELEIKSEIICNSLFSKFQLTGKTISLFLPIERQKEINTYTILEKGISLDVKIALPKTSPGAANLKHILYESQAPLFVNAFGIPEPKDGVEIKPNQFDFVLVPLLAIDKSGYRIGYGKGYYDRFLKKCAPNCIFIGLHLFEEFSEIDDLNKYDIPLNYCITPTQIIHFDN